MVAKFVKPLKFTDLALVTSCCMKCQCCYGNNVSFPCHVMLVLHIIMVFYSLRRSYATEDGEILIPIGVGVSGNVLIIVHHIRAIPIVKMSGRVSIK